MNSTVMNHKTKNQGGSLQVEPNFREVSLRIHGNIQDALALSRKLEVVLRSAHRKLLARDIRALENSLEDQVKLLNMLQINASLRTHYLGQIGMSGDESGISEFFNVLRQPKTNERSMFSSKSVNLESIEKYWSQLGDSASRCQKINDSNGRLLARLSASTRKIIELAFQGGLSSTYDSNGICVTT